MSDLPELPEPRMRIFPRDIQHTRVPVFTADQMRAYAAAAVAKERERLALIAKRRADYEASAAAHHAIWHSAHEFHMNRYAGMGDLIDALDLRDIRATPATPQPPAA